MIRRRLAAAAAALLLLLVFAGPVAAHNKSLNGASCAGTVVGKAWFWGNYNGVNDPNFGNHALVSCGLNGYSSNLANVTLQDYPALYHCIHGVGLVFGASDGTWNDCISSITVYVENPSYRLCLYTAANYSFSGNVLAIVGNVYNYNLPSWMNDQITSLRWRTDAQGC